MNWNIVINPFKTIADKILLLLGIVSFIIGCYLSYRFEMIYDGIFDAHEFPDILFSQAFTANTINVIVICLIFFAFGKIINPKTRMIDIMNTAFISRIPIYITVPLAEIPLVKSVMLKILDNMKDIQHLNLPTFDVLVLLIFSSVVILLLAYSITLMVNGFRTATNVKKLQHYLIFSVLIIAAEVLSKWIISLI